MSSRSFKFRDGEIYEEWLGMATRLSRWLDAPCTLRLDGTLTDAQRDQLASAIEQYDQSEQQKAA